MTCHCERFLRSNYYVGQAEIVSSLAMTGIWLVRE